MCQFFKYVTSYQNSTRNSWPSPVYPRARTGNWLRSGIFLRWYGGRLTHCYCIQSSISISSWAEGGGNDHRIRKIFLCKVTMCLDYVHFKMQVFCCGRLTVRRRRNGCLQLMHSFPMLSSSLSCMGTCRQTCKAFR